MQIDETKDPHHPEVLIDGRPVGVAYDKAFEGYRVPHCLYGAYRDLDKMLKVMVWNDPAVRCPERQKELQELLHQTR